MLAIRWAQGRLPELWPEIRDHGERSPWVPRWRDALAAAELAHAAVRAAARLVEINVGEAADARAARAQELARQSAAWLQQPPLR
jgi:hypothetical protein